jgi:cbb3-type cytochrome oxidase maturation protein
LFLWASKTGQFDDDYTPSVRMLFDDENLNENQLNDNLNGTGKI